VKVHQACNFIEVVSLWVSWLTSKLCCFINVCTKVTITSCAVCSVWRNVQLEHC